VCFSKIVIQKEQGYQFKYNASNDKTAKGPDTGGIEQIVLL